MSTISKMKRSRVDTNLKTKRLIIAEIEKGRQYKEVAKEFGISKSAVGRIYREREKFLNSKSNGSRKRARLGKFQKIEESCMLWLTTARAQNLPVTGPLLIEKAKYFAERFSITDFHGSDGWLSNFKMRNGITFKAQSAEPPAAAPENGSNCTAVDRPENGESTASVELSEWKSTILPNLLRNYKPCDVFNVGETGLFWRMLLDRSLVLKGNSISGGHAANARLTLLLGANMDGSEKLPILVIGKNAQPRCFKSVLTLPVQYGANKRAKVTRNEWENYLLQLDAKFKFQDRKVVLLVHKFPALQKICSFTNISLVYFPPNTTKIQPVGQGIIQTFKTSYRQSLLQMYLDDLEEQKKTQLTLLDALYGIRKAWHGVAPAVITNSFRMAGFVILGAQNGIEVLKQMSQNLQDLRDWEQLQGGGLLAEPHIDQFIGYDSGIAAHEVPNEDFIFATVLNKFRQQEDAVAAMDEVNGNDDSGNEDDEAEYPMPTSKEAKAAFKVLRNYVLSNENAEEALQNLLHIEQFIDTCFKRRCQRQ